MPDEVIVINDDSELEITSTRGYASDDSEVLASSSNFPPSSQVYDVDDFNSPENSSEHEFLNADALVITSQSSKNEMKGVVSFNSPQSKSSYSSSQSPIKRQINYDTSEDEDVKIDPVPPPRKAAKRRKFTEEEKAARKAQKATERERKKQENAAEKAAEKANHEAWKAANKLVTKKQHTLKNMTIQFSPRLAESSLPGKLKNRVAEELKEDFREYACKIETITDPDVTHLLNKVGTNLNTLGVNYIRWKRNVSAIFNETEREWIPLAPDKQYSRVEGTYLIYITGQELYKSEVKQHPSPTQQVEAFRRALGPRHHIHLMVCGWKNYVVRNEIKQRVERQLVELQIREGIHMEEVRNEDEAAAWIYHLSADLGNKPNKLIERSHLPFCPVGDSIKCGKNLKETAGKMLSQLPRLSDDSGQAIIKRMKTLNKIMEGYLREEQLGTGNGHRMLKDVEISEGRKLNNALSERLYNVLWANDPKALIG